MWGDHRCRNLRCRPFSLSGNRSRWFCQDNVLSTVFFFFSCGSKYWRNYRSDAYLHSWNIFLWHTALCVDRIISETSSIERCVDDRRPDRCGKPMCSRNIGEKLWLHREIPVHQVLKCDLSCVNYMAMAIISSPVKIIFYESEITSEVLNEIHFISTKA